MKLIILFILTYNLFAYDIKQNLFTLYQNKKYEKVCSIGFNNFQKYKQDEEFVSLYAFGCLNSDYIDRLAIPIATLKFSKEARANSAYFSVILMQKKLLYHALIDGYDLSKYILPSTDYVLSRVFDLYIKLGKHEPRAFYLFEDPTDMKLSYKLYISKGDRVSKMVIEEYYDTIILKRHVYW
ncbi:hypothetical protein [Sulfurimonas autotrophica]|uniref:Uncharacterized protein n=1 Tax=Sulfurimonas autotrophica (strain ATCC BAA-671 / DSM 16294 / JCM 11897 / OK10) TaxID=563040 RepID=E0URA3_SULAO|nr:hypothetical protein [Sulfurimonas autotrophica]ADN08913.1 conserved hypothetical protein [Sulfurimonas autotrophica DSM 16294]